MAVEVVHIHLHLTEVLVRELVEFEVDQNITTQQAVVEHKVHEEVVFVEGEALLPGLEEKAFAKFEKKMFNVVDDGGFKV